MTTPELAVLRAGRPDARQRFDHWLERTKRMLAGFSVRTKLLGIILALTVVIGLVVTWQVRTVMSNVLVDELDYRGEAMAEELAVEAATPVLMGDTAAISALMGAAIRDHPDAIYAVVLGAGGGVLGSAFTDEISRGALPDIHPSDDLSTARHVDFENGSDSVHEFWAPILDGEVGTVRVGVSEARVDSAATGVTTHVVATTVLIGLIGVAAASVLTWLLTRPILELVHTTREIGSGDLDARATHLADDEIGTIGLAFNQMVTDLRGNQETIAKSEIVRKRLLEQLIDAQEAERKRIARDLHDTVGQALSSLMVGMAGLTKPDADGATIAKRRELQRLAEETLDQVRQMSRELRPSALDDLGLAAALELYSGDFSILHPRMMVDLHVMLPDRLASSVETNLYRIVQEAMTNAARHSTSDRLSVLVTNREGLVRAIIEDEGEGFDYAAVRKAGQSVGIHGMQERAELVGGKLTIESSHKGTTVFVEVPV